MVSAAKLQGKNTECWFIFLKVMLVWMRKRQCGSIVFYWEMLRNFWTPNNAEHVPRWSLVTLCLVFAGWPPHIYRTVRLAWRNNCHCSCIWRLSVLHSSAAWFILKCLFLYIVSYREEWTGGDVQRLQRHGGHTVFTGGQFSSTNTKIKVLL